MGPVLRLTVLQERQKKMLHWQADAAVNSGVQTGIENIQELIVICQLKEHVFGLNKNNDLK